jgi:arabinose-5-phosphate isomerase
LLGFKERRIDSDVLKPFSGNNKIHTMSKITSFKASAIRTIEIERDAVTELLGSLNENFDQACEIILDCQGRVVVTGMGKSGHIGKKIAATLASTGTPAMYVHPAEASHGDIGMVTDKDVVLALSNSGTTEEITTLLPVLKRKGIALITVTGEKTSALAQAATVNLDAHITEEACPLGLAPTSSTTVALVLGDALAMALLEARGFTRDDFAISHPGGNLGRRLLLKVKDLMHTGSDIPSVTENTPLGSALVEMTEKGFGLTTVIDADGELSGVFTDGDLRRTLDSGKDIQNTLIRDVISKKYKYIAQNALAVEAAKIMQESNIYVLLVTDENESVAGIVKMHDLLKANVV